MNLDLEVQLFLKKLNDIKNKHIAVGYSAGADSTALLSIMKRKSEHFNFKLTAVFFRHVDCPIATGEENNLELAHKFCEKNKVNLVVQEISLNKEQGKSWEEAGRNKRLEFYKNSNYDYIFLGHHLDDQNETTMTQLFRGGGKGVSGMKMKNGKFCRPLLEVKKSDIYEYLIKNEIPWIEDPTNTDINYTRNFWRNVGLPTIEQHYPGYTTALTNFREKMTKLNNLSKELAIIDGLEQLKSGVTIDVSQISQERKNNLISFLFNEIGSYAEDKNIKELFSNSKNNTIKLKNGSLYLNNNQLTYTVEPLLKIRAKP